MRKLLWLLLLLPAFGLGMHPAGAQAAPVCVVGAKGVAPTATLAWSAPTLNTDGSPVKTPLSYNIYQGISSGGEVKVKNVTALTNAITTGLTANTTFYWYVTVVDAATVESAPSAEVCKSFPASVPNAVTVTIN